MDMTKRKRYENVKEVGQAIMILRRGIRWIGSKPMALERVVKGMKMRVPSVKTMTASVLGSRGAVGTTVRGLDSESEARYPWGCSYWIASGTLHFSR